MLGWTLFTLVALWPGRVTRTRYDYMKPAVTHYRYHPLWLVLLEYTVRKATDALTAYQASRKPSPTTSPLGVPAANDPSVRVPGMNGAALQHQEEMI